MHGYKCSRTYEYIMWLEKQKAFFLIITLDSLSGRRLLHFNAELCPLVSEVTT